MHDLTAFNVYFNSMHSTDAHKHANATLLLNLFEVFQSLSSSELLLSYYYWLDAIMFNSIITLLNNCRTFTPAFSLCRALAHSHILTILAWSFIYYYDGDRNLLFFSLIFFQFVFYSLEMETNVWSYIKNIRTSLHKIYAQLFHCIYACVISFVVFILSRHFQQHLLTLRILFHLRFNLVFFFFLKKKRPKNRTTKQAATLFYKAHFYWLACVMCCARVCKHC